MATLGEQIIRGLEAYGVDTVFGIPGVHTVELYRGLAASSIHHVTPRHEQGAGFMADGYARASGRPGVAFVITGPGLTNILTPMAQAYADSIPMLVISSVNRTVALGMGAGDLHEIRNQSLIAAQAAAFSHTISDPAQLPDVLARAWAVFEGARPRPVHIEIPLDLLSGEAVGPVAGRRVQVRPPGPAASAMHEAMRELEGAERPLTLCGGGGAGCAGEVRRLAEHLDAPVVMTTNARGVLPPDHPLAVPASPSLEAVRDLARDSDIVLAVGTEFGRTDYNVYDREPFMVPGRLIRVDIDPEQVLRGPAPGVAMVGDAEETLRGLLAAARTRRHDDAGAARAERARSAASVEIGERYRRCVGFLDMIRESLPDVPIVGDSTQAIYAGNLYYAPTALRRWFNAATGYGALGYGLPAAIGAARAVGGPAVALVGDGGIQFSLAEMGTAVEESLPLIVLVWNNRGYGEIKSFMQDLQITPVGVDLHTPDFVAVGRAYGVAAEALERLDDLSDLLRAAALRDGPSLIEIDEAVVLGGDVAK